MIKSADIAKGTTFPMMNKLKPKLCLVSKSYLKAENRFLKMIPTRRRTKINSNVGKSYMGGKVKERDGKRISNNDPIYNRNF